jgi:transporter family protein
MPKYLVLILISAFILGIYDLFKKASVKENAVMPVLFFSNVAGMLFFMLLTLLQGKFVEYACGIAGVWHFFLIFVKACIVASSWGLCFYAMRELPISIASPIRATAPFWTFIGSLI